MDLSRFRLQSNTDYDWYDKCLAEWGFEKLHRYIDKVWYTLLDMKPGQFLNIEKYVSPENYELFVKLCGDFCRYNSNYQLNTECNKIERFIEYSPKKRQTHETVN